MKPIFKSMDLAKRMNDMKNGGCKTKYLKVRYQVVMVPNHTFSSEVIDGELDEFTEAITLAMSGLLGDVVSPDVGFLCSPLSDNSMAVSGIVTCKIFLFFSFLSFFLRRFPYRLSS